MLKYFEPFKRIAYTFDDSGLNKVSVVNILQRSSFLSALKNNIDAFYLHTIKDGDNAEILSTNYYKDSKYNWIILLFNDIIDPYYDFPLTRERLESYVIKKYNHTNIGQASTTVHHYELETIIEEYINGILVNTSNFVTTTSDKEVDYDNGSITQRVSLPVAGQTIQLETRNITIDSSVFSYTVNIKGISNYDYEDDLNEKKRNIKILRTELLPAVEKEYKLIMQGV